MDVASAAWRTRKLPEAPMRFPNPSRSEGLAAPARSLTHRKVLVLSADADVRGGHADTLRHRGYEVLALGPSDPPAARRNRCSPDLVLLDIRGADDLGEFTGHLAGLRGAPVVGIDLKGGITPDEASRLVLRVLQ